MIAKPIEITEGSKGWTIETRSGEETHLLGLKNELFEYCGMMFVTEYLDLVMVFRSEKRTVCKRRMEYGLSWRCWEHNPTRKESEAIPWTQDNFGVWEDDESMNQYKVNSKLKELRKKRMDMNHTSKGQGGRAQRKTTKREAM